MDSESFTYESYPLNHFWTGTDDPRDNGFVTDLENHSETGKADTD